MSPTAAATCSGVSGSTNKLTDRAQMRQESLPEDSGALAG